jgi:phosphatidylinositol alpha-1,6-mannosyltransferase
VIAGTLPRLRRGAPPLAIGLHGSDVFLAERRGVRSLVASTLRRTRLLTGCSPELVERVARLGLEGAPTRVIPYGVDVDKFAPGEDDGWRGRLGIPVEAPTLLGVGRMATKKGFHVLVEALPAVFADHPEAHLILAGGGDRLDELRRATSTWKERVHFPGAVERDTLPDLYRAADLFVLPAVHDSRGNVDGLPNVILEAMASGLPVVASGISGIPLAVEDRRHGRLVGEGSPDELAAALCELLDAPDERRRAGERARERAVRELTWDAVAQRYRDAYCEALRRD